MNSKKTSHSHNEQVTHNIIVIGDVTTRQNLFVKKRPGIKRGRRIRFIYGRARLFEYVVVKRHRGTGDTKKISTLTDVRGA